MNKPREITGLAKSNESVWEKIKSPFGNEEYIPKLIDINPDHVKQYQNRWKQMKCLLITLIILLILLILAIILAAILIPLLLNKQNNTLIPIYNNITTTTTIMTTTTVVCIYPNVMNSNGRCVNIMIDSNNCGSLNNICENSSTCSAGICANVPGIQLNNSISIWSSAINGSADDQMYNVNIPWNITLYNITTNQVTVTTDGVLCFGSCSTTYTETMLPSNIFNNVTLFPFWDDLYIYINTSQGIYYQSQGLYPNRELIFEYYMSHYLQSNQFYHFQILFFENIPNIVQYIYYDATDGGDTCTIGIQASSTGPFILYSYDQPNSVEHNMTLIFDTNLGTFNKSYIR